jgi:Tol biopolymer transport system component
LRHILGESPNESIYIKTIPRRGYSFVADVRAVPDESAAAVHRELKTEIAIEETIEPDSPEPAPKALSSAPETKNSSSGSQIFKILIVAAIFLLIAGTGFYVRRVIQSRPSLNYSIENVRARRLTTEGNLGNSAPVSPDGNYLVYPVYTGGEGSLWVKQLQTGSLMRLTSPAKAQYWAYDYSPDGIYVYYIVNDLDEPAKSGLYRISTSGGDPQKLIERANGGLTFAPDGSRFALTRVNDLGKVEILTAKMDGSDERAAFVVPENKFVWSVKWSPDNRNLLCAVRERSDSRAFGYVAEIPWENDLEKPIENIVVPRAENQVFINAAWIPDKSSLLLSIRETNADICQIWQFYPANGERRRVTNDDHSYRFINLTRDGKCLVTVQESYQSETWIADTKTLDFQPVPNVKNAASLFWTKDDRLVYEALEDSRSTLFLSGADGAFRNRITEGGDGIYLFPALSGDGESVTFLSNRSGATQIWRADLDGQNAARLTNNDGVGLRSKLLSDNHTLLFMINAPGTGWLLYKQTDGKIVPLTKTDTSLWSVSPDEKLLAVELRDESTKKYRIHILSQESGELLKMFDADAVRQISWTRDAKAIVYLSPKKEADELVLQPIDGSTPKILQTTRGQRIASFDFSPDGSKLAIVRSKFMTDAFMIKAQEN